MEVWSQAQLCNFMAYQRLKQWPSKGKAQRLASLWFPGIQTSSWPDCGRKSWLPKMFFRILRLNKNVVQLQYCISFRLCPFPFVFVSLFLSVILAFSMSLYYIYKPQLKLTPQMIKQLVDVPSSILRTKVDSSL